MRVDYSKPPLLDVANLHLTIPTSGGDLRVLRGVDYQVWQGETLAVVGESGSGKSVSSLALMGLQPRRARVTADKLSFDGQSMLGLSRGGLRKLRGNKMAMIFQDPMTSLNPVLSIGEQLIETYAAHARGTRAQATERAVYLLERVGIRNAGERMRQYPHQLSGGLRQRVVIAIALMCNPKLIIADEPTTALDVTVQALILSLLKELQDEFGMALILISHDLGVVSSLADRVAIMYAGSIMESGEADAVIHDPLHPYTKGLIDCIPRLRPGEDRKPLVTIPGMVPSLIGHGKGCMFRNRCTRAIDACASATIDLQPAAAGRVYRCIHSENALKAAHRAISDPDAINAGATA